ncbi:hypothetical protein [Kallotenue papyrolyticum]|uniref:hypothetical protein n=1 Tax=Kallotenue papyrolyticum TaxID=1325125 RepID=UPI0004929A3E|nr:hypothetical protein [Kallotenue papyrolyticum]
MEDSLDRSRWARLLVPLVALLVIAAVLRAPQPTIVAPPDVLAPAAPRAFSGQLAARQATVAPPDSQSVLAAAGRLRLTTASGSYSLERVQAIASSVEVALDYVEQRTGLRLSGPVTISFDRRESCALDGAAFTERRVIMLYACPDLPPQRAVNILAHELVHQLAHDHWGAAHLQADLILSEGFATWGAGRYWLGESASFRAFVVQHYGAQLLPLGAHYRDYASIAAMNQLYYQWAALVEWILEAHGRAAFDRLYASGQGPTPASANYLGVLGGDLGAVEAAWRAWLAP